MGGIVETVVLSSCHVIGWVWNVVSFVPWYFASGTFKKKKIGTIQSVSIGGPEGPYRDPNFVQGLCEGYDDARTLDKLFKNAVDRFGSQEILGTRELISEEDEIQPNGRVFKKSIYGEYNWLTYDQIYEKASWLSSGIKALGAGHKERIIIFADTKAEWMITAQACWIRGFPVVTIYATLGDDGVLHGFNETKTRFAFTDAALLGKLLNLANNLQFLETIVYYGNAPSSLKDQFPSRIKIFSLNQIIESGSKLRHLEVPIEPPAPEDTAIVMYTSGSTGVPKGVIISHKNIVSAIGCLPGAVKPDLGPHDTFIAFLPLAHVMEIMCEMTLMCVGSKIGYSSALTLTDQSSKIKRGSKGDVSVLRPTLMAAVPLIMDRVRKSVFDKVSNGPLALQLLFKFAYSYKQGMVRKGYDTPILNRLIFSKMQAIMGGRIRGIISGGAPLSSDTQEFMNICFCCPVLQGYGLTETTAATTLTSYWDHTTGRVGRVLACGEVKLESWEEGSYTVHDKPYPRGEVLIGGNQITAGYLDQPEKTSESYVRGSDGKMWFHSGDIGEMHPDGVLKIVDRKKDLLKLAHGEYVSLGKVESILKCSNLVENCCVYGRSNETTIVALILPNMNALTPLAKSLGFGDQPTSVLVHNSQVVKEVLKEIQTTGKNGGLTKTEIPSNITLIDEEWTPENELVTAAMKLKRLNITNRYRQQLNNMYLS